MFDLDGEKIIIIREDQSDGFTESETCSVVHEIDDDKKKKRSLPSPLMLQLFAKEAAEGYILNNYNYKTPCSAPRPSPAFRVSLIYLKYF